MNKTGKVIRIISDDKLIVNLGSDYLKVSDEIEIFSKTEQKIIDPDTKEILGEYRKIKDTLEVIQVDKKFSVAEAKTVTVPMGQMLFDALNTLKSPLVNLQTVRKKLNIDEKDIDYLDTEFDKTIKIGDSVIKK